MGLSMIIAVLAFAIALVTLWLVSDIVKKVETQLESFLHTHIVTIHEEIRVTNQTLAKEVKEVKALTERMADIDNLRGNIAKVAENMDKLDKSIPLRYRVNMVPPEKAEQKVDVKPKPTVK